MLLAGTLKSKVETFLAGILGGLTACSYQSQISAPAAMPTSWFRASVNRLPNLPLEQGGRLGDVAGLAGGDDEV